MGELPVDDMLVNIHPFTPCQRAEFRESLPGNIRRLEDAEHEIRKLTDETKNLRQAIVTGVAMEYERHNPGRRFRFIWDSRVIEVAREECFTVTIERLQELKPNDTAHA